MLGDVPDIGGAARVERLPMRGVFLPARRTHREDNTSRERWAELYSMYQAGAPIWANTAQSEAVRARSQKLKEETSHSPSSSPVGRRSNADSSRLFDKKNDVGKGSEGDDEKAKQMARLKEKARARAAAARKAKAKAKADAAKAAAAAAAKAEEHRKDEEKKRAAAAEARAARQAAALAAKAKHEAHVAKQKAAAEARERADQAEKIKAEHDRHEQEMRAKLEEARQRAQKKAAEAKKHRRAVRPTFQPPATAPRTRSPAPRPVSGTRPTARSDTLTARTGLWLPQTPRTGVSQRLPMHWLTGRRRKGSTRRMPRRSPKRSRRRWSERRRRARLPRRGGCSTSPRCVRPPSSPRYPCTPAATPHLPLKIGHRTSVETAETVAAVFL